MDNKCLSLANQHLRNLRGTRLRIIQASRSNILKLISIRFLYRGGALVEPGCTCCFSSLTSIYSEMIVKYSILPVENNPNYMEFKWSPPTPALFFRFAAVCTLIVLHYTVYELEFFLRFKKFMYVSHIFSLKYSFLPFLSFQYFSIKKQLNFYLSIDFPVFYFKNKIFQLRNNSFLILYLKKK